MEKRDAKEFAKVFTTTAQAYGIDVDEARMEIYFKLLKKYALADVKWAFKKALETHDFFPVPAVLHRFLAPSLPEPKQIAREQAHMFLSYIKFREATPEQIMRDPVTRHLLTTRWSLEHLRQSLTVDEEVWFVKEFIQAYDDVTELTKHNPQLIEGLRHASPEIKNLVGNLLPGDSIRD